jgi:hypothetical protein
VILQIDECAPQALTEAPFIIVGGGAVWDDCLTPGPHELVIGVSYSEGLPAAELKVPFNWVGRSEVITWVGHVEPLYLRYCARANCHVNGFAPDTYETWVEKLDNIIERTALSEGEVSRMPPNGASPAETELLVLRWWREDGFLLE